MTTCGLPPRIQNEHTHTHRTYACLCEKKHADSIMRQSLTQNKSKTFFATMHSVLFRWHSVVDLKFCDVWHLFFFFQSLKAVSTLPLFKHQLFSVSEFTWKGRGARTDQEMKDGRNPTRCQRCLGWWRFGTVGLP